MAEVGLVEPGFVNVQDAAATRQQLQHVLAILLPLHDASLRIPLKRHPLHFAVSHFQAGPEHCCHVAVLHLFAMLGLHTFCHLCGSPDILMGSNNVVGCLDNLACLG